MKIQPLSAQRELAANEVAMSIDEGGMNRLMTVLSGVYENPPVAVLREATSNAFDSHVKAGVKRPILVTFPTSQLDSKTFRRHLSGPLELTVEDFGVGMDEAELRALYGKYGASTKVDSNREIGGFGIGAKSALSISDSFAVRARKGGIEVTLTVAKDGDGPSILTFSPQRPTAEPNGLKITVPITEGHRGAIDTATGSLKNFFTAAPANSILINGKAPASVHDRQRYVAVSRASEVVAWVQIHGENSYRGEQKNEAWTSRLHFVVGGVLYPVYKDMFNDVPLDGSSKWWSAIGERMANIAGDMANIYVNLPIGGIKLAPNREKIQLIESNARTIRATFTEFFNLLPKSFSSALNKIDSCQQALSFISGNWRMLVAAKHRHPERLTATKSKQPANLSAYLHEEDFRWRDFTMPNLLPVGTGGWVGVNAARGVNIETRHRDSSRPLPLLPDLIRNGLSKQPKVRILVEVPELDEASVKQVRNHLRTYGLAKFAQDSIYAYLVPAAQVSSQMREALPAVKLADFERIAKGHRRYLASLAERKPKATIQFTRMQQNTAGLKLDAVAEGHASLAGTAYFSALDAAFTPGSHSSLSRMFTEARRGGDFKNAGTHMLESSPTYLARYLGKPLLVLGSNRGAKVIAKNFDPEDNLLHHVYRRAQRELAQIGSAKFKAMVASGSIFGPDYAYRTRNMAEPLNLLAAHAAGLRSVSLRHALTFHAEANESQLAFSRVLGMIDWSRFKADNPDLDGDLLHLLGEVDESRFSTWFGAFARIKVDNAKVIASVLDALAAHHGWA